MAGKTVCDTTYEDIMQGRRDGYFGDIAWTLRPWEQQPKRIGPKRRSPSQIKKDVLKSQRLKATVDQLCSEKNVDSAELWKEAAQILDEMGHNYNMATVRGFGYVLSKLAHKFYHGIYVNKDGIEKVRSVVQDHPIILMPSHRSYVDFLLISYVFFHYNLPLPVIAAGMDFMAMKFVAERLRNAGAFFMRRSFGGDKLYWALFSEYVQAHVLNKEAPIEFFVEGTRSRTSKSLIPKFGLLSIALEPYFHGRLPDTMVVPITLSYDRTLEENLYAYELLGCPKPKESTSGLMRALNVMDEDYGTLHMHVSDPISIREWSNGTVDRIAHALGPPYVQKITPEEAHCVELLAYKVVREQQAHEVITPFVLVSVVLLLRSGSSEAKTDMRFDELVNECTWLKSVLEKLGGYVALAGSMKDSVENALFTHTSVANLTSRDTVETVKTEPEQRTAAVDIAKTKGHKFSTETMSSAVPHVILQHYANRSYHLLLRPAMVLFSLQQSESKSREDLLVSFSFLRTLFSKDFVFAPNEEQNDLDQGLEQAAMLDVVTISGNTIKKGSDGKTIVLFTQLFKPFFIGYHALCLVLLEDVSEPTTENVILCKAQARLEEYFTQSSVAHYTSLSLDLLRNGLSSLLNLGAARQSGRGDNKKIEGNRTQADHVASQIDSYVDWGSADAIPQRHIHSKL